MAWSRAFQKCIIFHLLDNFFCKHFYYITGFCDKKFNFCKFANFLADSKSRAPELSNDLSFVIFGCETWNLEVGSNWPPTPQHILVLSTPAEKGLNKKNLSKAFKQHLCYESKPENALSICNFIKIFLMRAPHFFLTFVVISSICLIWIAKITKQIKNRTKEPEIAQCSVHFKDMHK